MKTIALFFCWSAVVIKMVEPGRQTIDVDESTFVAEDVMRLCLHSGGMPYYHANVGAGRY